MRGKMEREEKMKQQSVIETRKGAKAALKGAPLQKTKLAKGKEAKKPEGSFMRKGSALMAMNLNRNKGK